MHKHAPPLAKHIDPAQNIPHDDDPKKRGRLAVETKHNEPLWLRLESGELVEIVARKRSGNKMRFVISAPQSVRILRDKLMPHAAAS